MPNRITWNANKYIELVYDASGNKWRKIVTDGVTKTVYDYFGGIEYKSGNFDALYHPEGRVTKTTAGTYRYEYTIKDHLGNGRVYFTDINGDNNITDSDILQEQNYYAFGAAFDIGPWYGSNATNPKSKYQYNGKEMNDDFGLNLSDYGARWYDANVGRWMSIDPLAEKSRRYSPYVYGNNNPIRFIDPDGMQTEDWVRGAGGKVFFDASITNGRQAADKGLEYLGKEITATDSKGVKYLGDNTGGVSQLLDEVSITGKHVPQSDQDYAQNIGETMGSTGPFAAFTADVIGGVFTMGATPYVGAAAEAEIGVVAKSGGRLGNAATRSQNAEIATELESRGYTITGGGGRKAEEFLKPIGGGRSGGSFPDITATHPNYPTLRINTVDVLRDGTTATARELRNAVRIRSQIASGEHLLLIPKK